MASSRMKYAIEISIAGIITALLMPTAIGLIVNATLPGADPTVTLVWQILLPVFIVLGLALAFMPSEIKEKIGLWSTPYTPNLNAIASPEFGKVSRTGA